MKRCLWLLSLLCLTACQPSTTATPTASPSKTEEIVLEKSPSIKDTVEVLATKIGTRNLGNHEGLEQARSYITRRMERAGYSVELQTYRGKLVKKDAHNLIFEKKGSDEILVVGAHYDSAQFTPGADDNASGVATPLYLAEHLKDQEFQRTVRFVFFTNEEPPYFFTDDMGSEVYAKRCKEQKENVVAMLSLETMGYYSDEPGSQNFPTGLEGYPDRGNFLAFIGNPRSEALVQTCIDHFEGVSSESLITDDVVGGLSDQASFWKYGYPGVMITDTAFFRNSNYHMPSDTPATLDFTRLDFAAQGLVNVVKVLGKKS